MKDLYVVNCCRTAIGSFGGSLKNTPAAEMGAVVSKRRSSAQTWLPRTWMRSCSAAS